MDAHTSDWLGGLHRRLMDQIPPLTSDNLDSVAVALRQAAQLLTALAAMPAGFWHETQPAPAPVVRPAPGLTRPPSGHRMVRRLRGGYLPDVGVMVPEAAVRRLELAHGDYLTLDPIGTLADGRRRYRFQLAERPAAAPPDVRERGELAMAIVESGPGGGLMVQRSADGPLPTRIALSAEDVQHLNLAAGDVVDLAYWADDPDDVRVCWVHRTRDAERAATPPAALRSPEAAARRPLASPEAEDDDGPLDDVAADALEGKRVLVVGCEPKRREYEAAIRRLGGEMEWAEGTEGQARLEAAIRRVDGVVLLTRFIRHQSFWDATALAKGHGVKVVACPKLGIRSVSRAAVELLA